ncbi:MAG: metallopeptidase [Lachnospiraceae bacterium]|nr:metallopeptidase [Lachnospiraceae bacterium]
MAEHPQRQYEWENEMAVKILDIVKSELYLDMRFMDVALSALEWQNREGMNTFATDGINMYYSSEYIIKIFKANPLFLSRSYLHTVIHCIYSHLWIRNGRDKKLWSLACDIVTEYTIDNMNKQCINRAVGWLRQQTYEMIKAECENISAASVYEQLKSGNGIDTDSLIREFYTDSHKYWPDEEKNQSAGQSAAKRWDKISRRTSIDMERKGDENNSGEQIMFSRLKAEKSRRSYREFLKKFAVLKEEMHCDEDEFDMNYYTYGLSLYGNMPLIEPLESREVKKIQDFVIVVDTSYSTSGELVKNFLKETFSILSQENSFFKKCRIRIIQCDDMVRMDEEITDLDRLNQMLEGFTIAGGGNTDFRPAFEYVDNLLECGEIKELKGLLYFTDGKGTYPVKRPPYDTVFLYLQDFNRMEVPPWAMTLRLEPEELAAGNEVDY